MTVRMAYSRPSVGTVEARAMRLKIVRTASCHLRAGIAVARTMLPRLVHMGCSRPSVGTVEARTMRLKIVHTASCHPSVGIVVAKITLPMIVRTRYSGTANAAQPASRANRR